MHGETIQKLVDLYIFEVVRRVELSNFYYKVGLKIKMKQERGRGKSFLLHLVLVFPFFYQTKCESFCCSGECLPCCPWFYVGCFDPLRCASLRPTAAKGCTSEYFNCANSSCSTVSELVMCIKPSAERCLLLGRDLFSSFSVVPFVIVSIHFLSWRSSGGRGVVIFCAVCSTLFYLLFIFFHCFILLLLFKIIFH